MKMKMGTKIKWITLALNGILLAVILFFVMTTGTKDYDYVGYTVLALILFTLSLNIFVIASSILVDLKKAKNGDL